MWYVLMILVPLLAGVLVAVFAPGEAASPTGCPACGSDDYEVLETGPDGPDYDGPKRCEQCGEEWT